MTHNFHTGLLNEMQQNVAHTEKTVRVDTNLTASAALVHENITVRHFKLNPLHWKIAAACSPFVN